MAARDLSKYQPRSVLFPRPPVAQKNQYVPVKRPATVDTRGIIQVNLQVISSILQNYANFYIMTGFCGTAKTSNQDRIVGGTEAVPNSLPWYIKFNLFEFISS